MSISIRRLSSAIGAEVTGVDFTRPLAGETVDQLKSVLAEHCILLFRDADISPEQHIAFSRRFGSLEAHILAEFSLPGHPEILVVSNVREGGKLKGAVYAGQFWHSDLSYMKKPSLGSLLLCHEMPALGGDTMWANMYLAYDNLSEPLKAFIGGLRAVHDYSHTYDTYFAKLIRVLKQAALERMADSAGLQTNPSQRGRSVRYTCPHSALRNDTDAQWMNRAKGDRHAVGVGRCRPVERDLACCRSVLDRRTDGVRADHQVAREPSNLDRQCYRPKHPRVRAPGRDPDGWHGHV